jgi:glycosyltransferase involved in cell wall biosynthesis
MSANHDGLAFIIVGRNEGWKLPRCIGSVIETVKANKLEKYEIIYIDSDSDDGSINEALAFENVRVMQIRGKYNAAVARNTGADCTKMQYLFFIDGDMEINPQFLRAVYRNDSGLAYDFVSGQLQNYNYDANWSLLSKTIQYSAVIDKPRLMSTCGGIFLIKHDIWDDVSGMDTRFKRGQDLDFSLTLSRAGILLWRSNLIIATHHTISYWHKNRIWTLLASGDVLYSKSFLYRKHVFNPAMYKKMLSTDYSMVALITTLALYIGLKNPYVLLPYLLVITTRALKSSGHNWSNMLNKLLFIFARDTLTLLGMLFFFPRKVGKSDYQLYKQSQITMER